MAFCYDKLKGRIKEICGTNFKFAELMGVSKTTMSAKLNNKSEFSQDEILRAVEILRLERSEVPLYFFASQVQISKQRN